MYVRFVVGERDSDSGHEVGVFHAARDLRDAGRLYAPERALET